jgi:hypothetical protein
MMAKTDPETPDLAEQIAQLRADMARIAETLVGLGQTFRTTLSDNLGALPSQNGQGPVEATLAQITDQARRNPAEALAVAAGLGLLLGLWVGRR